MLNEVTFHHLAVHPPAPEGTCPDHLISADPALQSPTDEVDWVTTFLPGLSHLRPSMYWTWSKAFWPMSPADEAARRRDSLRSANLTISLDSHLTNIGYQNAPI